MKSLSIEKMESVAGGNYTEKDIACGASAAATLGGIALAIAFPPAAITMGLLAGTFGLAWLGTVGIVLSCKD